METLFTQCVEKLHDSCPEELLVDDYYVHCSCTCHEEEDDG